MTSTPGWSETFHDLHSASTVEELWDVLVSWHGIRSSTQWEEPYVLFRRFHAEESAGAVVTAALLCTDTRWRKASHHLVDRIAGSGLLTGADLRQLAEWFVAPSLAVEIGVEAGDLDEPEVLSAERSDRRSDGPRRLTATVPEMHVVERSIWPPLRRWAAEHRVAEDPSRWRSLLDLAAALPSRDAAALAVGVMDAAAHIPLPERPDAVAAGLGSGSGIVRLAALSALAALEGPDTASARAATDPSDKVRAWTPTVRPGDPGLTPPPDGTTPQRAKAPGQSSLF